MTPTPPRARRKAGCLARAALLLASLVVSLLIAEVAVRIFGDEALPNPIGPRYLFRSDPVLGIDLDPGFRGRFALYDEFDVSVEINPRGFRDREFGAKQPGVTRVISLSDSFGFGYGVAAEHTWSKFLERRLNEGRVNPAFEVLNAGASGRGILHMIEILRRARDWFEPDIVIASYFYINDLVDIQLFPEHTVRGGIVLTKGIATSLDTSAWMRFCLNYSDLGLLCEIAWLNMLHNWNLGTLFPPSRVWGTEWLKVQADAGSKREELWQQFETHLATLREETTACGAKLVLMNIPQEYQTREELWKKMKQDNVVDDDKFDRDLISKKLDAICQRTGVPLLDLVPGFRAKPPEKTRFFQVNQHFNEAGHAFTAKLLDEFLRARGWVK